MLNEKDFVELLLLSMKKMKMHLDVTGKENFTFPFLPVNYCYYFDHLCASREFLMLYGDLCVKFINQYGGFNDTLFSEQLQNISLEKKLFPFYYPKDRLIVFPFEEEYFDSLDKKYPKELQYKMIQICKALMSLYQCEKFDQNVTDLTAPSFEKQYYIN